MREQAINIIAKRRTAPVITAQTEDEIAYTADVIRDIPIYRKIHADYKNIVTQIEICKGILYRKAIRWSKNEETRSLAVKAFEFIGDYNESGEKRRNLNLNERGLINMFERINQIINNFIVGKPKEEPVLPCDEVIKIDGYKFNCKGKRKLIHTDYDFTMNKKKYTEDFFQKTLEVDLDDGTKRRYLDENGRTVLRVLERIPTFDSSDREYDSYKMILIFEDNGKTHGIYLRGGYRLAEAVEYTDLVCADDETKEIIEKLKTA